MSWFQRPRTPKSQSASILAFCFAVAAAGCSGAGASMYSDNQIITLLLCGISILAVWYERNALTWARSRREREDYGAARMAYAGLVIAVTYTLAMQLTFFAAVLLKPMQQDRAVVEQMEGIDKRIRELETQRSWLPQVKGTAEALRREILGLESTANAGLRSRDKAILEAAQKANADLPGKRSDLAAAEGYEKITALLEEKRSERRELAGVEKHDTKSQLFALLFGGNLAAGQWLTALMVLGAVGFMQLMQVTLPSIAGKAELEAALAASIEITPPAAIEAPPERPAPVIEGRNELADQAARMLEARKEAERAKRRKPQIDRTAETAKPLPAPRGLAAKKSG